jgi:uncharacterized coiled-coil protein SlyX
VSALPLPAPDCAACAARDERIAAQQELIGELRDAVGVQAGQIAALREQVTRLERALSRNSGFSELQAFPSGCGSRRLVPAAGLPDRVGD